MIKLQSSLYAALIALNTAASVPEPDPKTAVAEATCQAKATDKKLVGAAKNSFIKKCVQDAAEGGD
jgi:hypothetical protein